MDVTWQLGSVLYTLSCNRWLTKFNSPGACKEGYSALRGPKRPCTILFLHRAALQTLRALSKCNAIKDTLYQTLVNHLGLCNAVFNIFLHACWLRCLRQTSRLVSCSLSAKGITRPQRHKKQTLEFSGFVICAMYWELHAMTPLNILLRSYVVTSMSLQGGPHASGR